MIIAVRFISSAAAPCYMQDKFLNHLAGAGFYPALQV
jgi:hypothetical protein